MLGMFDPVQDACFQVPGTARPFTPARQTKRNFCLLLETETSAAKQNNMGKGGIVLITPWLVPVLG